MDKKLNSIQSNNNDGIKASKFIDTVEKISAVVKSVGIDLKPYTTLELPYFTKLKDEAQNKALNNLETYYRICQQTVVGGKSLRDTAALTWFAIKEFGYRPPSELFNYINNENVIEIHTADGIQVFRNFEFYKYCSYTLEDLSCRPWNEIFEHDEKLIPDILAISGRVLSGAVKSPIPANIGPYLIKEVDSDKRLLLKSTFHYISPLFNSSGIPVAHIVIESGELVGSTGQTRALPPIEHRPKT